jgi:hypothetical protein
MVWHGPAGLGTHHGAEAFEENTRAPFIASFPDKVAVDEVRVFGDTHLASAGYQDSTFSKAWLGIPATDERCAFVIWTCGALKATSLPKIGYVSISRRLEQAGYDVQKVLTFVGSKDPAFLTTRR